MAYRAPLTEQLFALNTSGDLAPFASADLPAVDPELIEAILGETGKLAETVFAPLDPVGDARGARFHEGRVSLPEGFAAAYRHYVDAGWASLAAPEDAGGQDLPFAAAAVAQEQFSSANLAFSLCMMLSQGAIVAIAAHGSDELRRTWLPPLVSGRWTGTMNLTEPQAGSDLSRLRTRAEPDGEGTYLISGSKIFITWGEHDLAENIVHLVLARLPDAPEGTRGISLFLVPKYIPDEHGAPGPRNDVRCTSIEHKLGIHASPTCAMSFGDEGRCVGWLVGEAHAGLAAMFTMMNHARVNVGLQGVGVAEVACQRALEYARERVQSAVHGSASRDAVAIVEHADVRRMLMTMRALTDAARAIAYFNAAAVDRAHHAGDEAERARAQGRADLVTPITKAFATDIGVEVASLAIQVFGGMGYIEETGVARHYRDARIAPIYEGTNGIQALDLVGRKLRMDGGAHMRALVGDMRGWVDGCPGEAYWPEVSGALRAALTRLEETSEAIAAASSWDAASGATPYLRQFALVLGGVLLARQAAEAERLLGAGEGDRAFLEAKIRTARFFVAQLLPQAEAQAAMARAGGGLLAGPADALR